MNKEFSFHIFGRKKFGNCSRYFFCVLISMKPFVLFGGASEGNKLSNDVGTFSLTHLCMNVEQLYENKSSNLRIPSFEKMGSVWER